MLRHTVVSFPSAADHHCCSTGIVNGKTCAILQSASLLDADGTGDKTDLLDTDGTGSTGEGTGGRHDATEGVFLDTGAKGGFNLNSEAEKRGTCLLKWGGFQFDFVFLSTGGTGDARWGGL